MNLQQTNLRAEPALTADDAPLTHGRDAIFAALATLYRDRKPRLYENPHPWSLGGEDPLDAIAVWQRAEPVVHWHYITLGFSELYAKQGKNPLISGHGFELSFRLVAEPGQHEPPVWPMRLLQNLARYVFSTGNGFHDGHRLSTNGPITLGSATRLYALGFAFDPELAAMNTPNGHLAFLEMTGLTLDEERAAQQWETRKLLELMLPELPLWITDLKRESLLAGKPLQDLVSEGIRKDGSSCVSVYADMLAIEVRKRVLRSSIAQITLGARQIDQLAELLPLRLPYGRSFVIAGPRWKLQFELGRRNSWRIEAGVLHITVTGKNLPELTTLLHPRMGVYRLPAFPTLLWNVQQTMIRNTDGDVVNIIG
ncbi:MAG: suppressor of fused domain protein [Massilia sp.]